MILILSVKKIILGNHLYKTRVHRRDTRAQRRVVFFSEKSFWDKGQWNELGKPRKDVKRYKRQTVVHTKINKAKNIVTDRDGRTGRGAWDKIKQRDLGTGLTHGPSPCLLWAQGSCSALAHFWSSWCCGWFALCVLPEIGVLPWEFMRAPAEWNGHLSSFHMRESLSQNDVLWKELTCLATTSLFSSWAMSYRMTAHRECSSGSSEASRLIKAGMAPASTRACTILGWVEILLNNPTVLHCNLILEPFNRLINAGMVPTMKRSRKSMVCNYLWSICHDRLNIYGHCHINN